jgi:hypothetical protein
METMTATFARSIGQSRPTSEDAYYAANAASPHRLPRAVSAIAAFGLLIISAFTAPWPV